MLTSAKMLLTIVMLIAPNAPYTHENARAVYSPSASQSLMLSWASVELGDGQAAADLYGVDGRQRRHAMVEVKEPDGRPRTRGSAGCSHESQPDEQQERKLQTSTTAQCACVHAPAV